MNAMKPLSSAEAFLCFREAGEKGKESRGTMGSGKRGETREPPVFSLFPSFPARFLFFDYCYFCWDTQWGASAEERAMKPWFLSLCTAVPFTFTIFSLGQREMGGRGAQYTGFGSWLMFSYLVNYEAWVIKTLWLPKPRIPVWILIYRNWSKDIGII